MNFVAVSEEAERSQGLGNMGFPSDTPIQTVSISATKGGDPPYTFQLPKSVTFKTDMDSPGSKVYKGPGDVVVSVSPVKDRQFIRKLKRDKDAYGPSIRTVSYVEGDREDSYIFDELPSWVDALDSPGATDNAPGVRWYYRQINGNGRGNNALMVIQAPSMSINRVEKKAKGPVFDRIFTSFRQEQRVIQKAEPIYVADAEGDFRSETSSSDSVNTRGGVAPVKVQREAVRPETELEEAKSGGRGRSVGVKRVADTRPKPEMKKAWKSRRNDDDDDDDTASAPPRALMKLKVPIPGAPPSTRRTTAEAFDEPWSG